jgi:hypothetical protein
MGSPTPVIGMVGLIEPIRDGKGPVVDDGDMIVLLGPLIDPDCLFQSGQGNAAILQAMDSP